MKYIRAIYLLILFIYPEGKIFSQDRNAQYPVRFLQNQCDYTLLNPARSGCKADFEFEAKNQRMVGNLSGIATYYVDGNYRLSSRNNYRKPFGVLGMVLYNDQEGKYLNRTRIYMVYSWHTSVSRQWKMSGGLQFGGMNYNVKGTPLTGNGSDLKPDASVGILFYSSNCSLGLSAHQLINSAVQPLEELIRLAPYFALSTHYTFQNLGFVSICPSLSLQYYTSEGLRENANFIFSSFVRAEFKERLLVEMGLIRKSRVVFSLGIPTIKVASGNLECVLSYAFNLNKNAALSTPLLEFGIHYLFNRQH